MITQEEIDSIVSDNLMEEIKSYANLCRVGKRFSYDSESIKIRVKFDLAKLGILDNSHIKSEMH